MKTDKQKKRVKEDCKRFRKALEKMPSPRAMFTRAEFEEIALGGIEPQINNT